MFSNVIHLKCIEGLHSMIIEFISVGYLTVMHKWVLRGTCNNNTKLTILRYRI